MHATFNIESNAGNDGFATKPHDGSPLLDPKDTRCVAARRQNATMMFFMTGMNDIWHALEVPCDPAGLDGALENVSRRRGAGRGAPRKSPRRQCISTLRRATRAS